MQGLHFAPWLTIPHPQGQGDPQDASSLAPRNSGPDPSSRDCPRPRLWEGDSHSTTASGSCRGALLCTTPKTLAGLEHCGHPPAPAERREPVKTEAAFHMPVEANLSEMLGCISANKEISISRTPDLWPETHV